MSDEEPPTPPPRKKKKRDRKRKGRGGADDGSKAKASASFPPAPGAGKEWKPGCTFQRGMGVNQDWSKSKTADFFTARRAFTDTNTTEAIREKIIGIEKVIKKGGVQEVPLQLHTNRAATTPPQARL